MSSCFQFDSSANEECLIFESYVPHGCIDFTSSTDGGGGGDDGGDDGGGDDGDIPIDGLTDSKVRMITWVREEDGDYFIFHCAPFATDWGVYVPNAFVKVKFEVNPNGTFERFIGPYTVKRLDDYAYINDCCHLTMYRNTLPLDRFAVAANNISRALIYDKNFDMCCQIGSDTNGIIIFPNKSQYYVTLKSVTACKYKMKPIKMEEKQSDCKCYYNYDSYYQDQICAPYPYLPASPWLIMSHFHGFHPATKKDGPEGACCASGEAADSKTTQLRWVRDFFAICDDGFTYAPFEWVDKRADYTIPNEDGGFSFHTDFAIGISGQFEESIGCYASDVSQHNFQEDGTGAFATGVEGDIHVIRGGYAKRIKIYGALDTTIYKGRVYYVTGGSRLKWVSY